MADGFTQILDSLIQIFGLIYTSGVMLFNFLSTPIADSGAASELVDLIGDLAYYTPFELMFGTGLILVLIICLAKFVLGIF